MPMRIFFVLVISCIDLPLKRNIEVTMRQIGYMFLVLAIAFIALGISGNRTFLYVGIAFLFVGFLRLLPRRRR